MALASHTGAFTERIVAAGQRSRRRHAVLMPAAIMSGAALAVLVVRDGSPGGRLARAAGVALVVAGVVATVQRAGPWWRGSAAVGLGVVSVAAGTGFLPYLVKEGASITSMAAAVAAGAGLVLAVAGALVPTADHRWVVRTGSVIVTMLAVAAVTWIVGPAVAATNVPRPHIGATPASRGLRYESVTFATGDGVRLAAWYVPTANGAAVVLLHGAGSTRSDVLDEAAVLARHGFGVLLVDARGHGESGGRAMDFGWYGDRDVQAATAYLAGRSDVDATRLAVVGMSMGGEEAIGASGSNRSIRAVVAEGATARAAGDEAWLGDVYGWRGAVQSQLERLQDVVTDVLTSASVPTSLHDAVRSSGNTRYLLIAAGEQPDETHAAGYIAAAAPDRVDIWTVPGSGHTAGLATAPAEWERRVISFLDAALGLEPA